MINRLKKALGIESIKIHIDTLPEIDRRSGEINGELVFSTKISQEVHHVRLILIETYRRGRRSEKRIDDYVLGEWSMRDTFQVSEQVEYRLPFRMEFEVLESNLDRFQNKNALYKGVGKVAKLLKNAKSTYTLVAEAKAKGTALHPIAKKEIQMY